MPPENAQRFLRWDAALWAQGYGHSAMNTAP